MEKLEACPFCNSEAELNTDYDEYGKIIGYKVSCSKYCGEWMSSQEYAIAAWNRRPE
jgi:hypothetical protein